MSVLLNLLHLFLSMTLELLSASDKDDLLRFRSFVSPLLVFLLAILLLELLLVGLAHEVDIAAEPLHEVGDRFAHRISVQIN